MKSSLASAEWFGSASMHEAQNRGIISMRRPAAGGRNMTSRDQVARRIGQGRSGAKASGSAVLSVEIRVLVVLGALGRQLQRQAIAADLVQPDTGRDADRALIAGPLVARLGRCGGLATDLPAGIDELVQAIR